MYAMTGGVWNTQRTNQGIWWVWERLLTFLKT
jgi:hypothetical protein